MDELDKTLDSLLGKLETLGGYSAVLKKQAIDTFKRVMKKCLIAKFRCSTFDFRDRGIPMFSFELLPDDVVIKTSKEGKDPKTYLLEDILKNVKVKEDKIEVTLYPHDDFEHRDGKGRNREVELWFYFFRENTFNNDKKTMTLYKPNQALDIVNGKVVEDEYKDMDLENGTMKPYIG